MAQKKNPRMTSLEAGALIASGGQTTDVDEANLIAEGKLLDPDRLVRAYYRRELGFDLTVITDEEHHKIIVRNEDANEIVTATLNEDPDPEIATNENAQRIARAIMRLKRKHDKRLKEARP